MTRALYTVATGVLCALAAAGCALGPGASDGRADLRVTDDYGQRLVASAAPTVHESDSVIDLLDREADIQTRYGGGFVQSINGISGGAQDGRSFDWFFFVNGIESPIGSAQAQARAGDRIWWDHRDWTEAMRAPAVVGSFPEPFVHGFDGQAYTPVVRCLGALPRTCGQVTEALRQAGAAPVTAATVPAKGSAAPEGAEPGAREAQVLIGPWSQVSREPVARLLAGPPSGSGVFARFEPRSTGLPVLTLLSADDSRGIDALGSGAGLLAALRPGSGPPVWVVTGTDRAGVQAAADQLGPGLRDRYAVAVLPGSDPAVPGADRVVALPLASGAAP